MQLHREQDSFQSRGASLALVAVGAPSAIGPFREATGVTAPVFVDPTRATYGALGMRRGARTYLSTAFVRNMLRAVRSGLHVTGIAGDVWQQGGVLVVRPGGEVLYRSLAATAGDHPPVTDVRAALGPPRDVLPFAR